MANAATNAVSWLSRCFPQNAAEISFSQAAQAGRILGFLRAPRYVWPMHMCRGCEQQRTATKRVAKGGIFEQSFHAPYRRWNRLSRSGAARIVCRRAEFSKWT